LSRRHVDTATRGSHDKDARHARGCESERRYFRRLVLSQMDIAGGIHAGQRAQCRVATVAVEAMQFLKPVHVGDVLCVYAAPERVGRTSLAVRLEAWALRRRLGDRVKVTEGIFTFVALDADGRPAPIASDRQEQASAPGQNPQ
jgi:acyl-CoA thioesterase YciA